jgi:hypothetical protein
MDHDKISLLAQLIEKYGIFRTALATLLTGIGLSFPALIPLLKNFFQRSNDKKLFSILTTLGEDIRTIASQYSDSLSKQMVEILLERIYKHEFWILYDFMREVILKNDVETDKSGIETRIKMQAKLTFKAITNDLMKFKYKSRIVADFLACGAWEHEIYNTLIKVVFESKALTTEKRISNMRSFLSTEFGNIHFLTMQNINNF